MCPVPTGCAFRPGTYSPRRLYLVKALTSLTLLLLVPSAHAQSGSYTSPGPTGGMITSQPSYSAPYGSVQGGYGGSAGSGAVGNRTGSASCSGGIDQTYTWQGTDPVPQSVIVTQTSTASVWIGYSNSAQAAPTCDDGLQDSPTVTSSHSMYGYAVNASSSGTHYTTQGGASITVSCSPSASVSINSGQCTAKVAYSASISPVTIQLTGVTTDHKLLTGQQCTATLSGTNGYKVTSYTWSVGGKAFKNYDTSRTNNDQLVPLGPADLAGPAIGSTSVAPVSFYDGTAESLTVSCTASLIAPDGTSLSVTAKAPQITVLKPTITNWGIDTGFVQALTTSSNGNEFGLFKDPASSDDEGEQWHDVAVSVPSPFSGGQCTFTQIVNPDREAYIGNASTPIDNDNGHIGLDGSFQYGVGWSLPGVGRDGDSPALIANGNTSYTQLAASDALTTYVMYRPPSSGTGTVWIPLQKYSWSWSETLSWQNARWNITAAYPAAPGASPQYTPQNTDDPPQWNIVHGH